jgi:ribosomal protein L11 methyltransferase
MPWLAVAVDAPADCAEPLEDALLEAGALSVDSADAAAGTAAEEPVFGEPGASAMRGWRRNRITALFDPAVDLAPIMSFALRHAGLDERTPYAVSRVEDQDWVRSSQAQFLPTRISEHLWIVPSWHTPPDAGALNITLDPGLAFGTGTHPTTRLCLRWLEAILRGGETVIDYGCGSGILAIAALKLGAAEAVGIDIDPQALLAARQNAMQNQVAARFVAAEEGIEGPADVVVANILANPLIVLAPLIARLTRSGGSLALSGILAGQAAEVNAAYAPWFEMRMAETEDGWVLLTGQKR